MPARPPLYIVSKWVDGWLASSLVYHQRPKNEEDSYDLGGLPTT